MLILILNLVCTLLMTGVIWFVQIVHYPLFHMVGHEPFVRYEKSHQKLTSLVVVPLMLGEIVGAVLLIFVGPETVAGYWLWLNLALVVLIWIITFTVQVPLHRRLSKGYHRETADRLVKSNSIRTLLWTLKSGLIIYIFIQGIR